MEKLYCSIYKMEMDDGLPVDAPAPKFHSNGGQARANNLECRKNRITEIKQGTSHTALVTEDSMD